MERILRGLRVYRLKETLVTRGDNKQKVAMLHMGSIDHAEKIPSQGFDNSRGQIICCYSARIGDREMALQRLGKP